MKLKNIIDEFNVKCQVNISFNYPITIANIRAKKIEVSKSIKQLKEAEQLLDQLYDEYTIQLEPK